MNKFGIIEEASCTVMLAFPANIIALFLKAKEGTDVYNDSNPLKKGAI